MGVDPRSTHSCLLLPSWLQLCEKFRVSASHQHPQPYAPPTSISIYSLCQHTSKCTEQVCLKSFHVCVSFLALQIHKSAMSPTFSAIRPSYPTFYLFPAPTHLQTYETSSFKLIPCLHSITSPMDTRKFNGAHTLSYTPLLHPFPFIPHVNTP